MSGCLLNKAVCGNFVELMTWRLAAFELESLIDGKLEWGR